MGMSLGEVAHGLGQLAQRILAVDERGQFASFEKLVHEKQIFSIHVRDEEGDCLAGAQGSQADLEDVSQRSDETIPLRPADEDEGRIRVQDAPEVSPRAASRDVKHQVVAPSAAGEVLPGVVDHMVGAE